MQKYILKSGKIVEFNYAPIDKAVMLYRTIVQECKGAGLDLSVKEEGTTAFDIIERNVEAKLNIISSQAVIEAVIDCCEKVLYNKQRFSLELFEDVKNREDFFAVLVLVGVENLRPFFPNSNLNIIFTNITSQFLK